MIHLRRRIFVSVIVFFSILIVSLFKNHHGNKGLDDENDQATIPEVNQSVIIEKFSRHLKIPSSNHYAVFSSNTPNGESFRSYDYAFLLPLTALAWGRIGFRSIVLIAGHQCEWERDPAFNLILSFLNSLKATIIFIPTQVENRVMISQTSRIFAHNLHWNSFKETDYIITTDADLWPIHRAHYMPRRNHKLVLVHNDCCGNFFWNGTSFQMYPMSNIGAHVYAWKDIMNYNHKFANSSESILDYFEEVFGEAVRGQVIVGKPEWFMDQHMISIRIAEWIKRTNGAKFVYKVSDENYFRIDRSNWDVVRLNGTTLEKRYDAHLPEKSFFPIQWAKIKPLLYLMYGGNESMEVKWCEDYVRLFQTELRNFITFNDFNDY